MRTFRPLSRVIPLAVALIASGCGDEDGTDREPEDHRRDAISAVSDTVWTLAASPRFSTDRSSSEPDGFLVQPLAGEILEDGSVIVVDRGVGTLIWLDPAGVATHSAGGRGDGPGEFRSLSAIFRPPGSGDVWAWDAATRRLTQFDDRGELVSSHGLSFGDPAPEAVLPGPLFVSTVQDEADASGRSHYVFRDSGGRVVAEHLAPHPSGRSGVTVEVNGRTMNHGVPAGCVAAPGIVGVGAELLALDPSRGLVQAIAHDGTRIVRYRVDRREPMTEEARSAVEDMIERRFSIPGREAPDHVRREAIEQLRTLVGDTLPAWQSVIADQTGALWLERAECPRASGAATYSVIDLDGEGTGSVVVPAGLTVLAVRGREVLVRRPDELGVPHVEVYPLVARGTAEGTER